MQGHEVDGSATIFYRSVLGDWRLTRCLEDNSRFVRVEEDGVIVRTRRELNLTGTLTVVRLEGQLLVVNWSGQFRGSVNRCWYTDAEWKCCHGHDSYQGEQQEEHKH